MADSNCCWCNSLDLTAMQELVWADIDNNYLDWLARGLGWC